MTLKASNKKYIFLLVFLLVLSLLVFKFQSTLNLILPTNTMTRWITRTLEKELSVQTSIQDVRLSVFPRPAVEILDMVLSDPKTGSPWIRADSLEIKLKVLPLLQGRMIPESVLFMHPRILIRRDPGGKWLFMGHSPSSRKEREVGEPNPLPGWSISSVIIKDASVEILDQRDPPKKPLLVLQELDAHLKGISRVSPIRFKAQGHFPHRFFEWNSFAMRGEIAVTPGPLDLQHLFIDGDLSISDMPEEISRPYLKEFLDLHLISGKADFQGHYTLHPDEGLDMSGKLSLNNFLLLVPQYASRPIAGEEAVLGFSLTGNEDVVSIRHLALGLGEISLWGHGIWTRDFNGNRWYGLSLHATNLTLDAIRAYLPDAMLPSNVVQALQDAVSQGSLDIPLLEITKGGNVLSGEGSTGKDRRASLKIAFHDFGLTLDSEILPLEAVNGAVSISPESIRFSGLRGSYGSSRLEKMEGTLARSWGQGTDLALDARLNLKEIRDLVLRFPEPLPKGFAAARIPQARGYANIKARLIASDKGNAPLVLKGSADLIGAGFTFPFFPLELSGIYGRLTFTENNSLPFTLKGRIDQVPSLIKGKVRRIFSPEPSFLLRISANPGEKEFKRWIPTPEGVLKIGKENPGLNVLLQGTPSEMEMDLNLNLTPSALSFSDWMTKRKGVPSFLGFKARVRRGEQMIIEQGSWEMAGESVSFSGSIQGEKNPSVRLRIGAEHLSLQPLAPIFTTVAGSVSESTLSGNLSMFLKPGVKDSLDVQGDLFLSRVVIQPRFSPRPFREITGALRFAGKGFSGSGIQCRWGDLPFSLDVKVPRMDPPVPELRVRVPLLDLKSMIPEFFGPGHPGFAMDKKALKKTQCRAEIILQRVRHDRKELQDFRGNLILKDGVLNVPSFAASGLDGKATGKAWIDLTSDERPLFKAEAEISGVSAEKYLRLFPYNRTFYAGEISGSIEVEGKLYADLVETARKMKGKAHLLIRSTRQRNYLIDFAKEVIQRLEIIIGEKDELFRILEYDKMGGDFTIQDGKFYSRNFYIDQYHKFDVSGLTLDKLTAAVPIRIKYNIKAAGSFDFLDSDIDCYIMAEPFSLATRIVRKLPLAGKVLTGKDESLYSAYFRYKGHTSHEYQGTEKAARLNRTSYEALPVVYRNILKGPD